MKRTPCPKCGGFVVQQWEWNSGGLQVKRCMNCGWRKYPFQPGFIDPDTCIELLADIAGKDPKGWLQSIRDFEKKEAENNGKNHQELPHRRLDHFRNNQAGHYHPENQHGKH